MPRPPNCRIFIGNLASEKTSKSELKSIFLKYGNIIEDPIIRRSFGFVQYDNEESAQRAIESENGRMIGGMKIDCSLADNREPRYKSQHQQRKDKRRKERRDKAAPYPTERKNRPSNTRSRRNRSRSRERQESPRLRNEIHSLCHIVYSLPTEEELASRARNELEGQSIPCEIKFASRSPSIAPLVTDAFHKHVPFLLFVNCGGPHLNDLHVILPVDQAAVFKSVHLGYVVNFIKGRETQSSRPFAALPVTAPYSYSQPPIYDPQLHNTSHANRNAGVSYNEVRYPPSTNSINSPNWNTFNYDSNSYRTNEGNPNHYQSLNSFPPDHYSFNYNSAGGYPAPYRDERPDLERTSSSFIPDNNHVNTFSSNPSYPREHYEHTEQRRVDHMPPNDPSSAPVLPVDPQQLHNLIRMLQNQVQNKPPAEGYHGTNYRPTDPNGSNPPNYNRSFALQGSVDRKQGYISPANMTTQELLDEQMSRQKNARK